MGMFDTFVMDAPCIRCGHILNNWQSKQFDCLMVEYREGDRIPSIKYGTVVVIDLCGKCNFYNWARIKIKDYIVSGIEVVIPFNDWVQRINEIDETLGIVVEHKRELFWGLLDSLVEEYREKITENDDTDSSVSYDLAWNIVVRILFDWLPINVVRAFFKEAMEGKVK